MILPAPITQLVCNVVREISRNTIQGTRLIVVLYIYKLL